MIALTMMLKTKTSMRKIKDKVSVVLISEFGGFRSKICSVITRDMKSR